MKTELIVALDVDTLEAAEALVEKLSPAVKLFKIGSQLFTAFGPAAVKMVGRHGGKVFLDLKYHDIPNTVYNASKVASSFSPVFMITVHASGSIEMMKAAMEGAVEGARFSGRSVVPAVVGVTVLTSGIAGTDTAALVLERARAAKEAGLSGIVCSVHETAAVREEFPDFIIVNPGIRPAGADKDDQKRTAAPADAVKAGANYIVVGRPVIEAPDPLAAAERIVKEISGA